MSRKAIPSDALLDLRRRLAPFPPRSAARRQIMQTTATLYVYLFNKMGRN